MADINVKIGGDVSGLDKKLKGLRKSFSKFSKAVAVGIAGAVASFTALSKKIITLGDNIGKAAKRMGISAEEFQKLSFAAERSGTSGEAMEKAFKRMTSVVLDAEMGLTESVRALQSLGLTFDELKGKSPEKQFEMIADRLALIEDKSLKSALAQDVFGRGGTQLLPMLENYKALGAEAENLGLMSNEAVESAERLADEMTNLGQAIMGMISETGLLTWLKEAALELKALINLAKQNKGRFKINRTRDESLAPLVDKMMSNLKRDMGKDTDSVAPTKEETKAFKDKFKKDQADRERIKNLQKELKAKKEQERLAKIAQKEADKQAKKEATQSDTFKSTLSDIQNEISIQDLKNKGLEKEAELKNKIYNLEKSMGRKLTDDELNILKQKQKELASLTDTEDKKNMLTAGTDTGKFTDTLLRIGGMTGDKTQMQSVNLDRKRNELLQTLIKNSIKETPSEMEVLI